MPRLTTLASPAMALLRQATIPRIAAQKVTTGTAAAATTRSFSHLPSLRPTLLPSTGSVFRRPSNTLLQPTTTTTNSLEQTLDLVSKTSISAHPALAGLGSQIRCGPRPTMSGASRLIQKRRHGFLSRIRTAKGRKILAKRKAKGRRRLAA